MENIKDWTSLILGAMALMTNVFLAWNYFLKKDNQFDKELGINDATCNLKHQAIDMKFVEITNELRFIKENHLSHIEKSIANIDKSIAVILDRQNTRLENERIEKNK
jgi:regulatory protein YycI of two-component signal transduction system YycFG